MILNVDITFKEFPGSSDQLAAAMQNKAGIHEAMAGGVEVTVGDHLQGLNSRSPNTNFYASAARGIEVESDALRGLVRIPKLGFALRYYGGHVEPGKSISSFTGELTKALAIPTDDVPVVGPADGRYRQRPADAGLLAFLPSKKSVNSVGVLIQGEEKEITRGKRKGGKRIVPRAGGKVLYVLVSWLDHAPDESVLPTLIAMQDSAREGALAYLESFNE